MTYARTQAMARQAGLIVMGALHPRRAYAAQSQPGTLILLGTGPDFWPVFTTAPECGDGAPHPVDRWSKRILGGIADRLGATCDFPSDGPPYPPFIDWALKSGRFHKSPVGMMVHDTVGMMISLRGALLFDAEFPIPAASQASPCDSCADRPCTTACPVAALGADAPYDLAACHDFLDSPGGDACMMAGCAARRACPLSRQAGRDPAQSALHMRSFHPS